MVKLLGKGILLAFILCLASMAPLSAAPVSWVDWTSGTAGTSGHATGVLNFDGTIVNVNYSGEIAFIQTNGGANYWNPSSPYISSQVDNAPTTTDIIALSQATAKTLTFSKPVSGLLFAVVSLNGNGYRFNQDFEIVSTGCGYWGCGGLTKQVNGDGTYQLNGSGEPHGVIRFTGAVTSITWTSLSNEYWNGFTVGTFGVILDTTPPDTSIAIGPAEGATICQNTATIDFTGSDNLSASANLVYQWRLDGGAWSTFSSTMSAVLSGLAEGSHTFEVAAKDEQDNIDPTPATRTFSVDLTPPVISLVTSAPSKNECLITWSTDGPATSQIQYGTTSAYGFATTLDSNLVTNHSATISGLDSYTNYYFRVVSSDGCGREATQEGTFKTEIDPTKTYVWSLAQDYSRESNPNGAWSYGYSDSPGTSFSLMWPVGSGTEYNGAGSSNIWKNLGVGCPYGVCTGQVTLHPGSGGQYAVARWIAPMAAHYSLSGRFYAGDSGQTDGTIFVNGAQVFYAPDTGVNPTFSHSAFLNAGDVIDVCVGYCGSYYSDNTPVDVRIETVPGEVNTGGLKMWLRADSVKGVADGTPIATWADSSGNGIAVSQVSVSNQPIYVGNGLAGTPVIRFDGDDFLLRDSVFGSQLTSTDQVSIFVIMKQAGSDARNTILGWGAPANRLLLHATWEDWLCLQHGNAEPGGPNGSICTQQPATWDDAWHILEFHRSGNIGEIRVDGVALPVAPFEDTPEIGESHPLYVGTDRWRNDLTGDVAEILIYDRALSSDERIGMVSYLAHKYSLSLAAPPDTQITAGPAEGAILLTAKATFNWTGTDDATPTAQLQYSYRIDGGAWSAYSTALSYQFTGLGRGSHTFEVKAKDAAGMEDPTPASRQFIVDVDRVLVVNVNGGYDADGQKIHTTLQNAGVLSTFVHLSSQGQVATLLAQNTYEQIWVFDLSTAADAYTADWQAIADWFDADSSRAVICDGRMISSYWYGRYASEGQKLSENYYTNLKSNGGGLVLGTDHVPYQSGINTLNQLIGLSPFHGEITRTDPIPVDTTSPLMTIPNDMGAQLFNNSTPGITPYGLQPNGRILYTLAWHSGDHDTPGISSTIEGTVGYHIHIASPANGAAFAQGQTITFAVGQSGGEAPFAYEWRSTIGGTIGTGDTLDVSTLSPGQHTIVVRGTDLMSRVDEDSINITVTPDNAPPDTQITSGPGTACSDSATFDFTGTDDATPAGLLQYSWRADGGPWSAFSTASSALVTGLAEGPHSFEVKSKDLSGKVDSTPAARAFTADLTAPVISPVASTVSQEKATITWTTDEPSTSLVEYGTDSSYGLSTTLDSSLVREHSVTLTGLSPVTPYYYKVHSSDSCGHESVSGEGTFSTLQLPNLTIAPVDWPTSGYVGQGVTLRWRVSNVGDGPAGELWNDCVYLRPVGQVDGEIPLICIQRSVALEPGKDYVRTIAAIIPNVPEGDYSLVFKANANQGQPESNDSDNVSVLGPVQVRTVKAPVIADIADQAIPENSPYTGPIPVLVQGTLPVHWSLVAAPAGMTINTTTGIVSWPIPIGSEAAQTVTIMAANAAGFDMKSWNLTVPVGYAASVSTDAEVVPAGTPIVFNGQTTLIGTGQSVGNVPVSIRIRVKGTRRVFATTSNASGQFQFTFNPLANEAGIYTVSAEHPGVAQDTVQDMFTIVGMSVSPAQAGYDLVPGVPVQDQADLINLGDTPLTGIHAEISGAPSYLSVQVNPPSSLDSLEKAAVTYTVSTTATSEVSGRVWVNLSSAEGAEAHLALDIHIKPPTAQLSAQPASLNSVMLRGAQTIVQFDVTNLGGAATDQFDVAIPALPWLSLSTPVRMGPLAPGEKASVALQLAPTADVALGQYTGSVTVGVGRPYGITVPFSFDCTSDRLGDLLVYVEDEFTYWASGSYGENGPRVSNARVQLLDPDTNVLLHEFVTGDDGIAEFRDITEAHYIVSVEAVKHGGYRETFLVEAGKENALHAFMPRETVRYNWTVTPTDIQDVTIVTLQATFETQVPAPVVTVDPPVIDLASITQDVTQIDLKVKNHGLIKAEMASLSFGTHPDWRITPLISDLGDLAAQEERIIPVVIERLTSGAETQAAAIQSKNTLAGGGSATDGAPCVIEAHLDWSLVCIGRNWHRVPILVVNATGDCGGGGGSGGSGGGGGGGYYPYGGGGFGGGGGAGSPGQPYVVQPSYTPPNECKACDPATFEPTEYLGVDLSYLFEPAKVAAEAYILAQTAGWLVPDIKLEATGKLQSCCMPDGSISLEAVANATAGIDLRVGNTYFAADVEESIPVEHIWVPATGQYETVEVGVTAGVDCGLKVLGGGSLSGTITSGCGLNSPDIIVEGEVHAEAGVNASAEAKGEIKFGGTTIGSLEGTAYALFKTNASAQFQYKDGALTGSACFQGVYSEVNVSGKLHVIGGEDQEVTLIPCQRYYYMCPMGDCPPLENCAADYTVSGPCGGATSSAASVQSATGSTSEQFNFDVKADMKQRLAEILPHTIYRSSTKEMTTDVTVSDSGLTTKLTGAGDEGVCAEVRLQLQQQVAITRTAFTAALEVENAAPTDITDVFVSFDIRDGAKNLCNSKFAIGDPEFMGLSAVDGTGVIDGNSLGRVSWLLIPRHEAAPTESVDYFVGGILKYKQDGIGVVVPLQPARITVMPDPRLTLDYFWQRDVYSDDPFTPEVEPAEPFSLGLIMANSGYGTARNVKITSSQPEIIDNQKGLLIDFKIIGTQVGSQPVSPSLDVNLGDIGPQSTAVAQWLMTSSLQGHFKDYTATFKHTNPLGDPTLSLIDAVNIHELIHVVRVVDPADDNMPDFLVCDNPGTEDNQHLPNIVYNSNASTAPVEVAQGAIVTGTLSATNKQVTVNAAPSPGWFYIQVADPGQEQYELVSVVRSDGKLIRLVDNAWTTHRNIRKVNQPVYREHLLHIFDMGGSGEYTLLYEKSAPGSVGMGEVKSKANGETVTLGGSEPLVVTAVFPGCFYAQLEGGINGIKVVWGGPVSVGDRVVVRGTTGTTDEFERCIQASGVDVIGTGLVSPFALRTKDVGGCDSQYDPITGAGQRGVEDCAGANNIGMLIKVTGRVTAVGSNFFYIDDGTHARDCTIYRGVRVESGALLKPARGQFVAVTGVSTILRGGDRTFRKVRPRFQSDIQVITNP
ncbi:MAG: fibronectin type III domain-containing protein [Armatimonadota bacterium]